MFSNQLLNEIVKSEIELTVSKNGITIVGFYKSSGILLTSLDNGTLLATARYDEKTIIETLDDLVALNYKWWQYSISLGWTDPEEAWLPLLVASGRVKVKTTIETKTTYSY